MPPTIPTPTEPNILEFIFAVAPVVLTAIATGAKLPGVLDALRRLAALVAAKDAKQKGESNGRHTEAAMYMMVDARVNDVKERVVDVKEEARKNDEQLRRDLRDGMDSLLTSMNKFRADVRVGIAELHEKVDATNQRVNIIGSELTKLQAVVYSMNGNSKHASDDEKADE